MKKRTKSFEKWQKINADWELSGLTQREYCARNGLSLKLFEIWRHRVRKDSSTVSAVSVVEVGRTFDLPSLFPNQCPMPGSGIRIRRGDFLVDLEERFSVDALCRVLDVLRAF